jgi:hypothetical protein
LQILFGMSKASNMQVPGSKGESALDSLRTRHSPSWDVLDANNSTYN